MTSTHEQIRLVSLATRLSESTLKNTSDFQKNLEKVYRFAMVRPRSEKEFLDYFKRKRFNDSNHQIILDKLKNHEIFAKHFKQKNIRKNLLKSNI